MIPNLRIQKTLAAEGRSAAEPLRVLGTAKGILRRMVQILKRHCEMHILEVVQEIARSSSSSPLAAQPYEYFG